MTARLGLPFRAGAWRPTEQLGSSGADAVGARAPQRIEKRRAPLEPAAERRTGLAGVEQIVDRKALGGGERVVATRQPLLERAAQRCGIRRRFDLAPERNRHTTLDGQRTALGGGPREYRALGPEVGCRGQDRKSVVEGKG